MHSGPLWRTEMLIPVALSSLCVIQDYRLTATPETNDTPEADLAPRSKAYADDEAPAIIGIFPGGSFTPAKFHPGLPLLTGMQPQTQPH